MSSLCVWTLSSVYASVTLPFVQALPEAQTAWVRAILSKEQEADKILYEDDFCMLLPDTKWTDVHDLRSMYTLALLKDTSVRSVRDLTGAHLQPLKPVRPSQQVKNVLLLFTCY